MGSSHPLMLDAWEGLQKEKDGKVHWATIKKWVSQEPAFKNLDPEWKTRDIFQKIDKNHDDAIDFDEWKLYFHDWRDDEILHITRGLLRNMVFHGKPPKALPAEYLVQKTEDGEPVLKKRKQQGHEEVTTPNKPTAKRLVKHSSLEDLLAHQDVNIHEMLADTESAKKYAEHPEAVQRDLAPTSFAHKSTGLDRELDVVEALISYQPNLFFSSDRCEEGHEEQLAQEPPNLLLSSDRHEEGQESLF